MAGLIFPFLPHPDIVGNYLFLTWIIFGVFFCGWICPFGTIQDWINILAKNGKIKVSDKFALTRKMGTPEEMEFENLFIETLAGLQNNKQRIM